jgi:hypothetical protein
VIRSRGAVEVRLMAGEASRAVRKVVSARRTECRVVALCALQRDVSAGQCETGRGVIESGTGPAGGVVALCAGLREAGLHVVRICRALEIGEVASDASRASQAVSAGRAERGVVALITLQRDVSAGQREPSRGVVKSSAGPICGVVALLARSRESRLYVVRTGRAIEVFHVAGGAIGRRAHKLSVDMALRARHAHVRALQREVRELVVIESGRIPRALVVANRASGREARLRVRRIVGLIEIRHVAAVAGGGRIIELPAGVTSCAVERGVCTHQREASELQVIELRAHPVVHRVALFAGDGQT